MQTPSQNWHTRAARFLAKHTRASEAIIERFIELYWQHDADNDENLTAFQTYSAELSDAFTY